MQRFFSKTAQDSGSRCSDQKGSSLASSPAPLGHGRPSDVQLAVDNFASPKTIDDMIVDHTRGLHVGVADRRADELEAALLQIFAQRIRLSAGRRVVFEPS